MFVAFEVIHIWKLKKVAVYKHLIKECAKKKDWKQVTLISNMQFQLETNTMEKFPQPMSQYK